MLGFQHRQGEVGRERPTVTRGVPQVDAPSPKLVSVDEQSN